MGVMETEAKCIVGLGKGFWVNLRVKCKSR